MNTKESLKRGAKQLKNLFKGLGRKGEMHMTDPSQTGFVGLCHGPHFFSTKNITTQWLEVTCLACIARYGN